MNPYEMDGTGTGQTQKYTTMIFAMGYIFNSTVVLI